MIPDPTPDLDEVVTIDYPNHCKLLLYALLIREIEKPENWELKTENWDPDDYLTNEFQQVTK